jgi:hypothetical protein
MDTTSSKNHLLSWLRPSRDANIDVAVKGWNANSSTQQRGIEGDLGIEVEVVALSLEDGRSCYVDPNQKVAERS